VFVVLKIYASSDECGIKAGVSGYQKYVNRRVLSRASVKGPDRMANFIKIALVMIALMVGLTAAFQLYLEISGVLVQAAYAPNLSFTGISHFGRATYAGFSWFQNPQKPGPCPLVIHLADRDLGVEDLGNVERLRARAFRPDLPDERTTAMLMKVAAQAKIPYQPLPPNYVRRDGHLLISVGIDPKGPHAGLRSVWVGYRMAEPRPWPRRSGIVSIGGKRLPLPVTDTELAEILGPPLWRQQGWP